MCPGNAHGNVPPGQACPRCGHVAEAVSAEPVRDARPAVSGSAARPPLPQFPQY